MPVVIGQIKHALLFDIAIAIGLFFTLRPDASEQLIHDWREVVADDGARRAFDAMIAWARRDPKLECFPHPQGYIRSFRFLRGINLELAFAPNQQWLLFYFRAPYLRNSEDQRDRVRLAFPDAKTTSSGEISLRIKDEATAQQVIAYVTR